MPQSALTPEVIREGWRKARGDKPCKAWIVVDTFTLDSLFRQNAPDFSGLTFQRSGIFFLRRFDVVGGRRVEIPFDPAPPGRLSRLLRRLCGVRETSLHEAKMRWYTAPFQDYPVFDGKTLACLVSARRVLPPDRSGEVVASFDPNISLPTREQPRSLEPYRTESSGELAVQHFHHLREKPADLLL